MMIRKLSLLFAGLMFLVLNISAQINIKASEFDILPNDGINDAIAISNALLDSRFNNGGTLSFEEGVYNLTETDESTDPLIEIKNRNGITIQGAIDAEGNPVTIFERDMTAPNAKERSNLILNVYNCNDFSILNIVFENNPEFSSAGIVKTVDELNDYIEVEVFEDLPHFDGMFPCSANAWDLETKELLPIEALTIGTDASKFPVLNIVSKENPRLYRANGGDLAKKLKVGDGMSWHFYVANSLNQMLINRGTNIRVENVHMYNSRLMSISPRFCKNLTFKKVILKPEGNQLAVGSRDAFHLICNTGKLLMEDCYIKGYRWDPMNIKSKIGRVEEIIDSKTIKGSVSIGYIPSVKMENDSIVLYTGNQPTEVRYVISDTWSKESIIDLDGVKRWIITIKLSEDIPESLSPGDAFAVYNWLFDEAIIRRCNFEGNFGRPILYQGHNLLVDSCTFHNNAYANIALGPINLSEGSFVRNIQITNNTFSNSTWLSTTAHEHNGTIKIYENLNPGKVNYNYNDEPYNYNILIENNTFFGINYTDNFSAICVENATGVVIRNNTYENNKEDIYINPDNTLDVKSDWSSALNLNRNSNLKICPTKISDGYLKLESIASIDEACIYNVQGRLVKMAFPKSNQIDVSCLSKGVYFTRVNTNNGVFAGKFIIE